MRCTAATNNSYRVVVTGVGIVSSLGLKVEEVFQKVVQKASGITALIGTGKLVLLEIFYCTFSNDKFYKAYFFIITSPEVVVVRSDIPTEGLLTTEGQKRRNSFTMYERLE